MFHFMKHLILQLCLFTAVVVVRSPVYVIWIKKRNYIRTNILKIFKTELKCMKRSANLCTYIFCRLHSLVSCQMDCLLCHLETPDIPKVSLSEWWFLLWQLFAKLWPQKFPRNTDLKVFHTKVLDNIFSHFDIILSFGAVLFTLLGHCSPNQWILNP